MASIRNRLELEITETALLGAEKRNHEILRSLRSLGVRVSIDDFGTGYSSMSYLQHFEIDKIKIDKRFVQGLDNGANRAAPSSRPSSTSASRSASAPTAEGVETTEQLATSASSAAAPWSRATCSAGPLTAEDAARLPAQAQAMPPDRGWGEPEMSSWPARALIRPHRPPRSICSLIEYFIPDNDRRPTARLPTRRACS